MVCKLTIYNNDQCILLHSLSKEKRESILLHIVDEMQNYYAYYRIYSYGYLGLSVTWAYPTFGMTLNLSARCAISERGQCGFVNLTKLKKKTEFPPIGSDLDLALAIVFPRRGEIKFGVGQLLQSKEKGPKNQMKRCSFST